MRSVALLLVLAAGCGYRGPVTAVYLESVPSYGITPTELGKPHEVTVGGELKPGSIGLALTVGNTMPMQAFAQDDLGKPHKVRGLHFSSTNQDVCTVDLDGVVTARHPGMCAIVATFDDVVSTAYEIVVTPPPVWYEGKP